MGPGRHSPVPLHRHDRQGPVARLRVLHRHELLAAQSLDGLSQRRRRQDVAPVALLRSPLRQAEALQRRGRLREPPMAPARTIAALQHGGQPHRPRRGGNVLQRLGLADRRRRPHVAGLPDGPGLGRRSGRASLVVQWPGGHHHLELLHRPAPAHAALHLLHGYRLCPEPRRGQDLDLARDGRCPGGTRSTSWPSIRRCPDASGGPCPTRTTSRTTTSSAAAIA